MPNPVGMMGVSPEEFESKTKGDYPLREAWKSVRPDIRLYLEFLAGNNDSITEEDFTEEQLLAFRQLLEGSSNLDKKFENSLAGTVSFYKEEADRAKNKKDNSEYKYWNEKLVQAQKDLESYTSTRDKSSVSYGDYSQLAGTSVDKADVENLLDPTTSEVLLNSLGEFRGTRTPDGGWEIDDSYEFIRDEPITRIDLLHPAVFEALLGSPRNMAEWAALMLRPEHERQVAIKLPPIEQEVNFEDLEKTGFESTIK